MKCDAKQALTYFNFALLTFEILTGLAFAAPSTNEVEAWKWFKDADKNMSFYSNMAKKASWAYNTNITDANSDAMVKASLVRAKFRKELRDKANESFNWKSFTNTTLKRLFKKLTDIGTAAMKDPIKLKRLTQLISEMEALYSTATVKIDGKNMSLEPDLVRLFASSRDPNKLKAAWKGWRDASGKKIRKLYQEFVQLHNEGVKDNGYANTADYWQSWYEYRSNEAFEKDMERLFNEVNDFYRNLHYYVKRKLIKQYGIDNFPNTGHIPAHLLGNMWAQRWGRTLNFTQPFDNQPSIDVTPAMVQQNYTEKRMFELSEDFFTSLGMFPMTKEFWNNSMIKKPTDRDVVCHASAWDFSDGKDFRIKQCTDITLNSLITVHHEMGHIQYYQQYKDQYYLFRRGANPGFHEAVGDLLALSVSTPKHLKAIGLLDTISNDADYDINFLFAMALDKVGFIPFGYLIDKWRWDVFNGKISDKEYNKKWWDLRCSIQGVSPPVKRTEEDFDPGAKYHVPGNTPYIRYFVSRILQFQFHSALCKAAGHKGPLHKCDIYNNTAAGTQLSNGLRLGSSEHWEAAMQEIAKTKLMSTKGLMEYFDPLIKFLKKENGNNDVTWKTECPGDSSSSLQVNVFLSVLLVVVEIIFIS